MVKFRNLPEDAREKAEEAVAELEWEGPWMLISSVTKSGTNELMQQVSDELERIVEEEEQLLAMQEAENGAFETE